MARVVAVIACLLAAPAGHAAERTLSWAATHNNTVDGDDVAQAVALDAAGNVYVAGWEKFGNNASAADILIIKYDPAGNIVWSRTHNSLPGGTDYAFGVALGPDGSLYVAGSVSNTGGASDGWLRKYTAAGDEVWTTAYVNPSPGDQVVFYAVAVDPVGGSVYVAGCAVQSATLFQFGNGLLAQVAPGDGTVQWVKTFDGGGADAPWDEAFGVAVGPGGVAVVTGYETQSDASTPVPMLTLDILDRWARRFEAGPSTVANKLDTRTFVRWFSPAGLELYTPARYAGDPGGAGTTTNKETANAVAVDAEGSVFVTGATELPGPFYLQRWVTKYADPGGPYGAAVQLWSKTIGEASGNDQSDIANGVALDPRGGLLVAGESNHGDVDAGEDGTIEEFDPTQAFVAWKTAFNSGFKLDDMATAIAANAAGDVAVVGWERRSDLGEKKNWFVLKYALSPAPARLLGNTRAWPSPFDPDVAIGGAAKFGPLPDGGTVKIYTLGGGLVREIREQSGIARWDGRNGDGVRVAEGVYFWVASARGQATVKGTLAVTRR